MKSIRGSLNLDHGWQACYPGGKDTPDEGEFVLALYYSHCCPDADPDDDLVMDLVMYMKGQDGGYYWSYEAGCSVSPLCWHPLPELPSFLNKPEQEGIDFLSFDGTN